MKNRLFTLLRALCVLLAFSAATWPDEGMWLIDSINKLPLAEMRKHGLELTPDQICSPNSPSLKNAIVLLGGGTASFVSAEGLLVTNHHIAFAGIQELSSVKDDYLKNGFRAKTRNEELATSYTAQIVVGMKDVTTEVLSALSDTMSAEQRASAVLSKSRELESREKGNTELTCRVSEMFHGVKYHLFTYEVMKDVRLVYAPPSAIGYYGGEIDNWTWPRHNGDFSFMRVYVGPDGKPAKFSKENVPYKPNMFLPISTQGYGDGSFAMLMGFPGRTYRYREASAVELARDETLPTTIDLYKTRADIIKNAGQKNRAVQIKYAALLRRLANTSKNYTGTLEGMRRTDLLTLRRKEEAAFLEYIRSDSERLRKYGSVLSDMEKAGADLKTFNRKNILLTNLTTGVELIRVTNRLRTYTASFTTDSVGNTLPPAEAEQSSMRDFIASTFKNFDLNVEKQTLAALILKSAEMPTEQQLALFQEIVGNRAGIDRERRVREFVDDLYDRTSLGTPDGCERLLGGSPVEILQDEYMKFAAQIEPEQAEVAAKTAKYNATIGKLRATFMEGWLEWRKAGNLYPDANRTLRLAYGVVKPLSPRDAVDYRYATTLTGVMEKERDEDPFVVPPKLKELWLKKNFGRYADRHTGDIPVAFITDLDITGGNSGSPVINGKGELIGCAFDGNWEGIVGDYLFDEKLNRTISVDARYILFVLDKFSGAENILRELVVR